MEDGIERSKVNYEEEKEEKYVYIFLQSNGNNYIIFFNKDKAIEYSRKNSCRVDIFIEAESSVYTRTKKYYENGVLGLFCV